MSSDDEDLPLVNALRLADAARATAAGARALLSDDASDDKNGGDADIVGDAATAAPLGSSPAKAGAAANNGSVKATPVKQQLQPRESVSPVPDWIKSATPSKPPKPATSSDDSSDGKPLALKANALRAALGMDGEEEENGEEAATTGLASAAAAASPPKAAARGGGAAGAAKAAAKAAAEEEAAAAATGGGTGGGATAAAAAAAAATATTATTAAAPAAAAPNGAAAAAAAAPPPNANNHSTGIPLYVPDRLPASRFLVELEDAVEGGRMDLAGDAGVVGRLLVAGPSKGKKGSSSSNGGGGGGGEEFQRGEQQQQQQQRAEHEVRLDLKGRLYRATIVPSSSTLAVVNVQADAARVEAVSRCFLKLDPEAAPGDDDDGGGEAGDRGGAGIGFEFDDDEDPWAMAPGAANAGKGGGGGGGEGDDGKAGGGGGGGGGKKRKKAASSSMFGGGGGGGKKGKAKPKKKRK